MEETDNKKTHSLNIITLIIRWRKVLLIVGIAAALLSAGISMLITPRFKSTVIMMSTSSNALSQMVLLSNNNEHLDAAQFGDDEKIDQMLQILNSREMKDHLIKTFNLREHYEIDTNSKYWKTKLYKTTNDNFRFSRTRFMGVEINVLDKDPQLAADIANEIADYYDVLKGEIVRQRTEKAFEIIQKSMEQIEKLIAKYNDSMSFIMSHGLYDYESQSERLMQQYVKEIASGNTVAAKRLEEKFIVLEQWAPKYISARYKLLSLKENHSYLQQKYQSIKADAEYVLPQKFIVESAIASDKKAYPKRMIIVLMSTICTLAFAVFLILCQEGIKRAYTEIKRELSKK